MKPSQWGQFSPSFLAEQRRARAGESGLAANCVAFAKQA